MIRFVAQSLEFFRRDLPRAWGGTVLFAGVMFLALLMRTKIPAHDSAFVATAGWLVAAASRGFVGAILLVRVGRYVLWLISLWGHSRNTQKSHLAMFRQPFDEGFYENFSAGIRAAWLREKKQFKDAFKFRQ